MAKKRSSRKTISKEKGRSSPQQRAKAAARNRAHRKEKGQLIELVAQLCRSFKEPPPIDKKERLPFLEMLFCLILKVYLQVSYRTLESFLDEMRKLNYITRVPFFNSFGNYMNSERLTNIFERMIDKTGLVWRLKEIHAAIDSTKLFFPGYHQEKIKKGSKKGQKRWVRNYVRLHVIVDTETYQVLTARVSASYEDEKKFFGPLLRQAAQLYHILSIAGDKNYLSKVNIKIAEELGCKPYLYPKKNYKADPRKSPAWNSNLERHREGTEEDAKRIRQRRQIETTFSMIKLRLSAELNSKKIEALINEALCLVICHNLRVRIFNREMYGTEVVFPPDDGCEAPLTAEPSTTSEPEPTGSRPDGGGL